MDNPERTFHAGDGCERDRGGREGWAQQTLDALKSLPEFHRRVISMAYFQGLSHADVARALGVAPQVVSSAASHGLQRVAAAIESSSGSG